MPTQQGQCREIEAIRLVEQTEAHVVVRLLLLLDLLLGGGSSSVTASGGGGTARRGTSRAGGATRGDGGELGRALSDELYVSTVLHVYLSATELHGVRHRVSEFAGAVQVATRDSSSRRPPCTSYPSLDFAYADRS